MARWHYLIRLVVAICGSGLSPGQAVEPRPPVNSAAEIRDIRGPAPEDSLPPFALTGGALLVAGALLAIQRQAGRRQKARVPSPVAGPDDASEVLAGLAADYRHGVFAGDELIVRLDELLRRTLAERTGLPAQSLTSAELLRHAESFFNDQGQGLLSRFVLLCDQVKFADYRPAATDVDRALKSLAGLLDGSLAGPPA